MNISAIINANAGPILQLSSKIFGKSEFCMLFKVKESMLLKCPIFHC